MGIASGVSLVETSSIHMYGNTMSEGPLLDREVPLYTICCILYAVLYVVMGSGWLVHYGWADMARASGYRVVVYESVI